jgi:hypothetical protein
MAIQQDVLSTLTSIEGVVTPPPMLARVLDGVFRENVEPVEDKQSPKCDPSVTARMLRIGEPDSQSNPGAGKRGSDYGGAKSLVLSLSIYNQLVDRGFFLDRHFYAKWQAFLEIANAAQYIAALYNPALVEKAFLAGLLHDFGAICLWRYFPEESSLAQSMTTDGTDILSAEQGVFGTDHQEIGRLIAAKWGMPRQLTEVIGNHHLREDSIAELEPLTTITILADNLLFIRQMKLETVRSDQARQDLINSCCASLGIESGLLNTVYSVFPKHFLYTPNPSEGRNGVLRSFSKMNDELFGLYVELGRMFKERQELSRRMLEESREEGTLESLKMALSTLSHYINNTMMSISGRGEMLQLLYENDDKDGVFEKIPNMTRTINKTVRKIAVILEELSSIISLTDAKYFKNSMAIDIDSAIRARMEIK